MNSTLISRQEKISQAFDRAAKHYDQHADFQRVVAVKLLEKLPIDMSGMRILDVGSGTGFLSEHLIARGADVVCLDLSEKMLKHSQSRLCKKKTSFVRSDASCLPFVACSFDLVVSSLAIQWCDNLRNVFAEFSRVLTPSGQAYFTSLLDGSLQELKDVWRKIDSAPHVNQFTHLNTVKFALAQAGCQTHQIDSTPIIQWYRSSFALMKDLKGIGATFVEGRVSTPTSRRAFAQVESEYQQYRSSSGLLPATYHVLFGVFTND